MTLSPVGRPNLFSARVVCRFLAIFLPIALLASAAILALHAHDLSAESALHEQASRHLIDLHATIITREMESIEADILYLADTAPLRDYIPGKADFRRP